MPSLKVILGVLGGTWLFFGWMVLGYQVIFYPLAWLFIGLIVYSTGFINATYCKVQEIFRRSPETH